MVPKLIASRSSLRRDHNPLLAAALLVSIMLAGQVPQDARACGGCVAPPLPPESPLLVKQAAERILFIRNGKTATSTVHIEIRYTGLAKDFGWVLPLPAVPKVSVGSDLVFDGLESATRPAFTITAAGAENCRNPAEGCKSFNYPEPDTSAASDTSAGWWDAVSSDGADSGPPPGVEILASGETGPFQYLVLAAKDAAPLLGWLNDNGYSLPAAASSIVQSHLDKGDVFVAVKLQNGQGIEAIRPIVLEMPGTEACVPLRLTSIAAVDDMDVQVYLVGEGRGIPKNALHVVPNPVRFSWSNLQVTSSGFEPANYLQTLSAAIDEADGAAFVTEFAQPGLAVGTLGAQKSGHLAQTKAATSLPLLASWIEWSLQLTSAAAVTTALDQATDLPEQLSVTAAKLVQYLPYCYQPFWYQMGNTPQLCLEQYLETTPEKIQAAKVDGAALAAHVEDAWWAPIADVDEALKATDGEPWLTRLHLRIDPTEMDRDPLFAFNTSLPAVSRHWNAIRHDVCADGWLPAESTRWSFADIGSWVRPGAGADLAQSVKAPAALRIELLDEQGPPMIIAGAQAPQLAAAVAGAIPGKQQLPEGFVVVPGSAWQPPASDLPMTQVGGWPKPQFCVAKNGWVDGQVPPDHEIPDPPDSAGLDVSGVDSWQALDVATSPTVQTTAKSSDGCSATRAHSASGGWLAALLGVGLAALRLRRRSLPARARP